MRRNPSAGAVTKEFVKDLAWVSLKMRDIKQLGAVLMLAGSLRYSMKDIFDTDTLQGLARALMEVRSTGKS